MQRPVFATNDFVNLSVPRLIGFALNVATRMTANSYFTGTPPVPTATITTLAHTLQEKQAAAIGGGTVATDEMHQAEKDLIAALKTTTRHINNTAYNNKVAIDSTGFNASAGESGTTDVPGQLTVSATQGSDAGSAILEAKGGKGVKAYTFILYPADGPAPVVSGAGIQLGAAQHVVIITDTHPKVTVTGLQSLVRYHVVAFAVNASGRSALSNPVDVVAK